MASFTKDKIRDYLSKELIKIDPIDHSNIQCNSYDFRLGREFRCTSYLSNPLEEPLDTKEDLDLPLMNMDEDGLVILPGELYLMSTYETFTLSDSVEASVDGRSSLARYGISAHLTAGNIKPGFKGIITLEVTAVVPVRIYPLMKFGQIMFSETDGPPCAYEGRYQNQTNPLNPFIFEDD